MIGVVRNELLAGKIIRGEWRHNKKLQDVGYEIIKKHNFKCSGCNIQSLPSKVYPSGMMVPANLKHAGFAALSIDGATCLCPLCASALATNWSVVATVDDSKVVKSPGFLVFMPYQKQADLTRLAIFAMACLQKPNDHPFFSVATDIGIVMNGLADEVGKRVPIYDGNNTDFVKALSLLPDEYYEKRSEIIGVLRWWPNMSYWEEFARYIYKANFRAFEKNYGLEKKIVALMRGDHGGWE